MVLFIFGGAEYNVGKFNLGALFMSKLTVFMADGMEEVECLAVVDIARRAGITADLVSTTGRLEVVSSHGVHILADHLFEEADFEDSDALFLPGGIPGANNLAAHEGVCALVRRFAEEGRHIAAICAAPSVLGGLGLLDGRTATCHPGWEDKLGGAVYTRQGVVTDGNITTGRGLGFAIDLGLELVRLMQGAEQADDLRRRIQYPGC